MVEGLGRSLMSADWVDTEDGINRAGLAIIGIDLWVVSDRER